MTFRVMELVGILTHHIYVILNDSGFKLRDVKRLKQIYDRPIQTVEGSSLISFIFFAYSERK